MKYLSADGADQESREIAVEHPRNFEEVSDSANECGRRIVANAGGVAVARLPFLL